jgi:hypothetical protein
VFILGVQLLTQQAGCTGNGAAAGNTRRWFGPGKCFSAPMEWCGVPRSYRTVSCASSRSVSSCMRSFAGFGKVYRARRLLMNWRLSGLAGKGARERCRERSCIVFISRSSFSAS